MARGNAYIIIPAASRTVKVPAALLIRLGWQENIIDPQTGEVTGTVAKHPTWQQAAKHFKSNFGDVRKHVVNGKTFYIAEFEFSFIKGEVKTLVKLQQASKKDFLILNASEARRWLAGENIFL